jgi:hypothetical protein
MLVVTLITALYIAIRPQPLQDGALRLVSPARRQHAKDVMHQLAQAYVGWLRGLAAGMAVLWVVTYIGLMLVGLPYPVVWATLTAIAMVVPYYGALVSAVPPILLALTISPGTALLVALVYLVAHQVEGNLIEPLVMARAVERDRGRAPVRVRGPARRGSHPRDGQDPHHRVLGPPARIARFAGRSRRTAIWSDADEHTFASPLSG